MEVDLWQCFRVEQSDGHADCVPLSALLRRTSEAAGAELLNIFKPPPASRLALSPQEHPSGAATTRPSLATAFTVPEMMPVAQISHSPDHAAPANWISANRRMCTGCGAERRPVRLARANWWREVRFRFVHHRRVAATAQETSTAALLPDGRATSTRARQAPSAHGRAGCPATADHDRPHGTAGNASPNRGTRTQGYEILPLGNEPSELGVRGSG